MPVGALGGGDGGVDGGGGSGGGLGGGGLGGAAGAYDEDSGGTAGSEEFDGPSRESF